MRECQGEHKRERERRQNGGVAWHREVDKGGNLEEQEEEEGFMEMPLAHSVQLQWRSNS